MDAKGFCWTVDIHYRNMPTIRVSAIATRGWGYVQIPDVHSVGRSILLSHIIRVKKGFQFTTILRWLQSCSLHILHEVNSTFKQISCISLAKTLCEKLYRNFFFLSTESTLVLFSTDVSLSDSVLHESQ